MDLQQKVFEKLGVEDISAFELIMEDSDSEIDEGAMTQVELDEMAEMRREKQSKLGELYEIMGILGVGAFGVVFKARDRKTGRKMALKIAKLNPSFDASSIGQT